MIKSKSKVKTKQFDTVESTSEFMLNEPLIEYGTSKSVAAIAYPNILYDKMALIRIIREGVPYSLFKLIQSLSPFTEADWSNFLDISTKSLQRYKQAAKSFKPIQSEKIIELAEVTNIGTEVFGSLDKFKMWLDTPNYALEKYKPKDLLKDSYGKELVLSELTNINHGILV